jgi:hypothetical protein
MYSIPPLLQYIWQKQSPWKAWQNCEYSIMAIKWLNATLTIWHIQILLVYYYNC